MDDTAGTDDTRDRYTLVLNELLKHLPGDVVSMVSEGTTHAEMEKIVMFIDVSGFTAMTEKFSVKARAGIDALTTELNNYLSRIVDHIVSYDGEVIKFAGDAILACWPSNRTSQVIECSIDIQQTCSNYLTTPDEDGCSIELNVRMVMGLGDVEYIIVSTDSFSHYFLLGPAIDQIRQIEPMSEIRTLVLSRNFWEATPKQWQQHLCAYMSSEDDVHVKVAFTVRKHKRHESDHRLCEAAKPRPAVSIDKLSKFVIDPVLDKIANLEPLAYASEMRYISICFINIELQRPQNKNICHTVNEIFVQIDTVSRAYEGLLTKSIGFDKGLSFLCLFGLGGTESNCSASALDAADEMRAWLSSLEHTIYSASIGVASGVTYCGVVGHRRRHEYTSIGRKVNLSARLMCYYPNIVSCDEETAENSKLPAAYFRQLPSKAMKGFKGSIRAFEYKRSGVNGDAMSLGGRDDQDDGACLGLYGRRFEILIVCVKIISMLNQEEGPNCYGYSLVFRGEDGSGRSMLLQHLFNVLKKCREGLEVLLIKCLPTRATAETSLGYQGLMTVLGHMLCLESMSVEQRKELNNRLCKTAPVSDICRLVLSEWLDVDKSVSAAVDRTAADATQDRGVIMEIINLVMTYVQRKQYIILLDDLHHVDEESLRVITHISRPPQSILIGTGRIGDKILEMCPSDGRSQVDFKTLLSFKEVQMQALLCRMFKVQSIEKGLLKVLHQRTRGLPGLCLEAVVELRRSSLVDIRDIPPKEDVLRLAGRPPPVASKSNLLVDLFFVRTPVSENTVSRAVRDLYCPNGDPKQLDMPTTIEAAFMKQYDRLSAFERSLLSNCSILSSTFSKDYLFGTCWGNVDKHAFIVAVKTLFENRMLICAHNDEQIISSRIKCCCPHNSTGLPFFCKIFRFGHESVRIIVLSSMTRQTIRYRRINALKWLEAQLPDTIASSIQWPACSIIGGSDIKLAESYLLRSSVSRHSPLAKLVSLARIKSLEDILIGEEDEHQESKEHQTTRSGRRPLASPAKFDIFNIVRNAVVACHFVRIDALTVKMKDGTTLKTRAADIFQCWNFVDERSRVNCFSYTKIFGSAGSKTKSVKGKVKEQAAVNKQRHRFALNYESVDERMKKSGEPPSPCGAHCNCDERLRLILEEILKHSIDIHEEEKTCYYSLQLALLFIKNQRPLLATKLLARAEKSRREKPALEAYLYYVKARYEFCLSHDYQKAAEYLFKGLSMIRQCRHCQWSIKRSHQCTISTGSGAAHVAKKILVLMYVVARADCKNTIADRHDIIKDVSAQLDLLSQTTVGPEDFQTLLVLAEEYYNESMRTRVDGPGAYCVEYKEMLGYLGRMLRLVRHETMDTIAAMIYVCMNYVCLEWAFDIEQAFDYATLASVTFVKSNMAEQLALFLPYLCLTCTAADKIDIVPDKLEDFRKMLNRCHLRKSDLRRSLYCALYNCVLLDFTSNYGISAAPKDLATVSEHLRMLHDEIDGRRDELSFMTFRPCSLLYCLAVVSKAYSDRSDISQSSAFLKLAFREAETQIHHLSMLDPLTQRSLLLLSESQLANCKESEGQNGLIAVPFISVIHCIHRRSFNYPMYCALNALAKKKEGAGTSNECKTWTKKAVHSAVQLGSQCELERVYQLMARHGILSRERVPSGV